jgi:hypothetical protein
MRTVYKYPVQVADEFEIGLPAGAEILHVAVQHYKPQLWALVDTERPIEVRRFAIRGTGYPVEHGLHHVGSFLLADDTFVGHLFEHAGDPDPAEQALKSWVEVHGPIPVGAAA